MLFGCWLQKETGPLHLSSDDPISKDTLQLKRTKSCSELGGSDCAKDLAGSNVTGSKNFYVLARVTFPPLKSKRVWKSSLQGSSHDIVAAMQLVIDIYSAALLLEPVWVWVTRQQAPTVCHARLRGKTTLNTVVESEMFYIWRSGVIDKTRGNDCSRLPFSQWLVTIKQPSFPSFFMCKDCFFCGLCAFLWICSLHANFFKN